MNKVFKADCYIVCFDFDGVCTKFKAWRGFDIFDPPVKEVAAVTQWLRSQGHHPILWTTRLYTPKLQKYLDDNGFVFDSVNSVAHNPPHTSSKPIADVYIDDKGINFNFEFARQQCDGIVAMINGLAKE